MQLISKVGRVVSGMVLVLVFTGVGKIYAQEGVAGKSDLKQELNKDAAQFQAARGDMKMHAQAAIVQERQLVIQIQQAQKSGEVEKAQKLGEQLKVLHQQNVARMQEDLKNFQGAKQSVAGDLRKAMLDRVDTNHDGQISPEERQAALMKQADFNNDGKVDDNEKRRIQERLDVGVSQDSSSKTKSAQNIKVNKK